MKKYIILNLICLMVSQASAMGVGYASIVYEIVDTENHPVEGAHVTIYWSDTKGGVAKGVSDRSGRVTLSSNRGSLLTVAVEKEGYYRTRGEIWEGNLRTAPPKSFTVTLKRIINPVPMVHGRFEGDVPRVSEPVAFDFELNDWVAPYGKGKSGDIYFIVEKNVISMREFYGKITIFTEGDFNGIQEYFAPNPKGIILASQLSSDHQAPLHGYVRELKYEYNWELGKPAQDYEKRDRNYVLRTRSVVNEHGDVEKANYVRTIGEIKFDPRGKETAWLRFEYYYNPDPESRSLEPLDMKR